MMITDDPEAADEPSVSEMFANMPDDLPSDIDYEMQTISEPIKIGDEVLEKKRSVFEQPWKEIKQAKWEQLQHDMMKGWLSASTKSLMPEQDTDGTMKTNPQPTYGKVKDLLAVKITKDNLEWTVYDQEFPPKITFRARKKDALDEVYKDWEFLKSRLVQLSSHLWKRLKHEFDIGEETKPIKTAVEPDYELSFDWHEKTDFPSNEWTETVFDQMKESDEWSPSEPDPDPVDDPTDPEQNAYGLI